MLWYLCIGRQARPLSFRAPSWPWAAVEGWIKNNQHGNLFGTSTTMANFVEVAILNSEGENSQKDHLRGNHLKMKGPIKDSPPFSSTKSSSNATRLRQRDNSISTMAAVVVT